MDKKKIKRPLLEYGKVPPSAIDLEKAILGALMTDNKSFDVIEGFLRPEMFYKQAHHIIFEAICELNKRNHPFDILSVDQEVTKMGSIDIAGGTFYIMQLVDKVSSGAYIDSHARIVQQKFIQRELIRTSSEIIKQAYDESTDPIELLDTAEKELASVIDSNFSSSGKKSKAEWLEEIKEDVIRAASGVPIGLSTGLECLDDKMPLEDGMIYLFAARPGMGKTSFVVCQLAKHQLDKGTKVMFASLEMPEKQLLRWFLEAYGARHRTVKFGKFFEDDRELYEKALKDVGAVDLHLFGESTLSEIFNEARFLIKKGELDILYIDYLQLIQIGMDSTDENRIITKIMGELKAFAKKYNIPIVLLSQLNRDVEKRGGNKVPQLSDLRASGSIEQGCDSIIFLFRAAYYDENAYYLIDNEEVPCENILQLAARKFKDGKIGDYYVSHSEDMKKFWDYESTSQSSSFDVADGMNPNRAFEPDKDEVF
jgi:replicative DNA helicase